MGKLHGGLTFMELEYRQSPTSLLPSDAPLLPPYPIGTSGRLARIHLFVFG